MSAFPKLIGNHEQLLHRDVGVMKGDDQTVSQIVGTE